MNAGEVGIVYRQRGIAVEVAGIGHRGGKINNPAGCVHRADTDFVHRHVSDKTLADGGMRVGIKIGPNLLSVMTSPVGMTINRP